MAYINYMAIDARCIVKEAQLMGSALDRLARNTDLRYDELCNRTAVKQIKDALGAKKIKDKGARQGAKHLITVLEAIYPALVSGESVSGRTELAEPNDVEVPKGQIEEAKGIVEAIEAFVAAAAAVAPAEEAENV